MNSGQRKLFARLCAVVSLGSGCSTSAHYGVTGEDDGGTSSGLGGSGEAQASSGNASVTSSAASSVSVATESASSSSAGGGAPDAETSAATATTDSVSGTGGGESSAVSDSVTAGSESSASTDAVSATSTTGNTDPTPEEFFPYSSCDPQIDPKDDCLWLYGGQYVDGNNNLPLQIGACQMNVWRCNNCFYIELDPNHGGMESEFPLCSTFTSCESADPDSCHEETYAGCPELDEQIAEVCSG